MFDMIVTTHVRRMFWSLLHHFGEKKQDHLDHSAIVFAPHPDDETLGCGGTILLKKKAGAQIHIVMMTDGRHSHWEFVQNNSLIEIRRKEAIAAAKQLGLRKEDLTFFPFCDGKLESAREEAIAAVVDLLNRLKPAQVYVPYHKDPHTDHQATHQIVMEALARTRMNVSVYEYAVWLWYHWPIVGLQQKTFHEIKIVLKHTLKAGLGLIMLRDFRNAVYIASVLEEKRAALNEHRTQMVRPESNPSWPVLPDAAKGDFLKCFFREKEVFYRYTIRFDQPE